MAQIELRNVGKSFDGKYQAVNNVSFTAQDGEFLTLLGPSGCGKTTLLRIIAGLETPENGNVFVDGIKMNDVIPAKRDLAMVFQSYALYPHMNVSGNIAIGLKLRKVSPLEIAQKVREVSQLLSIENLLDRKPRALSGGQRQRVALARAIVRHPKAFLLDEPLSNLDSTLREKTRGELKILFTKLKITAIYVTHDQVEAMSLSDRIAVINQGLLQQIDTPDRIYHQPANMFVAGFVGSPRMNFINTEFIPAQAALKLAGKYLIPLPDKLKTKLDSVNCHNFILGIRPEDIKVYYDKDPDAAASDKSLIPTEVSIIEPLGAQTVLGLRIGRNEIKALLNKPITPSFKHAWVKFNRDKLYIFETVTGNSLISN